MTQLLFIRHGETDWNRQQRFQGHLDVPLNANGRAQAQRLVERLASDRHDALFTSDLLRARETAAPLADAWALPAQPMPGLREQGFGVLEGLDFPTIQTRHPDLWQRWQAQRADDAPPGGETLRQLHQRVLAAVQQLAGSAGAGRIAIVTHGGVLDMLWRSAHRLPLDGHRQCAIPNTGLNRLRWTEGALQIDSWADATHLQGLPPQAGTRAVP